MDGEQKPTLNAEVMDGEQKPTLNAEVMNGEQKLWWMQQKNTVDMPKILTFSVSGAMQEDHCVHDTSSNDTCPTIYWNSKTFPAKQYLGVIAIKRKALPHVIVLFLSRNLLLSRN